MPSQGLTNIVSVTKLVESRLGPREIPEYQQPLLEGWGQNLTLKFFWSNVREAKLKMKPCKCCIMTARFLFLRYIVTQTGVEVNTAKIEAVRQWLVHRSVKDMRASYG